MPCKPRRTPRHHNVKAAGVRVAVVAASILILGFDYVLTEMFFAR